MKLLDRLFQRILYLSYFREIIVEWTIRVFAIRHHDHPLNSIEISNILYVIHVIDYL